MYFVKDTTWHLYKHKVVVVAKKWVCYFSEVAKLGMEIIQYIDLKCDWYSSKRLLETNFTSQLHAELLPSYSAAVA